MRFLKKKKGVENWWTNVADLMAGLMMVFMFIAVSYMASAQKEARSYFDLQANLYQDLEKAFKDDLDKWQAKIDPQTAAIRFEEPDVLFESGKAEIRLKFKEILDDFFPRYLNIVWGKTYKDNVEEIRIEGHTSSIWSAKNGKNPYFGNMELSQDRTRNVLEYVYKKLESEEKRIWLKKHLTANGLSSSKLIYKLNGKEDRARSRRVEFRIRMKTEERMKRIAGQK